MYYEEILTSLLISTFRIDPVDWTPLTVVSGLGSQEGGIRYRLCGRLVLQLLSTMALSLNVGIDVGYYSFLKLIVVYLCI